MHNRSGTDRYGAAKRGALIATAGVVVAVAGYVALGGNVRLAMTAVSTRSGGNGSSVPTAAISATSNPCNIEKGKQRCRSTISFSSQNVRQPKIQVRLLETNQIFACRNANLGTVVAETGEWITPAGYTFVVYPAASCAQQAGLGAPLAAVHVSGALPVLDGPTCVLDNRVLDPTKDGLVGVAANDVIASDDYLRVAELLGDAGVRFVRKHIEWTYAEPTQGDFRWGGYDPLFDAFVEEGMEPLGELMGTPQWASSDPAAAEYGTLMPADLAHWRTFVRRTVQRYGTERKQIRNWEIWNEPNLEEFFGGSMDDYTALLRAATEEIRAEDPTARVWAGAITFNPWSDTAMGYVDHVIANGGDYDVLSVHLYFDEYQDMVDVVTTIRAKLDAAGRQGVEIAVTEVNLLSDIVDCPTYNAMTQAEHAVALTNMYACLGNAGADAVFWFKATDVERFTCAYTGEMHVDGLVDTHGNPKQTHAALAEIAEYLRAEE